jgi:hypothetical protein
LAQRQLTGDEREVLRQAADFLRQVVDGARFTSSGTFRAGARPSQSMAALDFAEIPIDSLKVRGNRADFFAELASAVASAANNRVPAQRRQAVNDAIRFFEALHHALQLKRELRRQVGSSARRRVAA